MQKGNGFLKTFYEKLGSVKLSVFIFLILAGASIIGTLIPQTLTHQELHARYSPTAAWWIETLGLNDLYRTNWFRLLLLLLSTNLVICSLQRLPKTLKLLRRREEAINPSKLVKFAINEQFTTPLPLPEVRERLEKTVSGSFAPVIPAASNPEGAFCAVSEKGRWSRFMVYIVHLSVLFILVGALIGSLAGMKGYMSINEGETVGSVALATGDQTAELPFQVRCDDFSVTFYDTGQPKEFKSELTVLEGGREVHKQSIVVNDPMTWQGFTFYQSSYGTALKKAELQLKDLETGKTQTITVPFREMVPIPESKDQIQVVQYQQDLQGFGPALGITVTKPGKEVSGSWILAKMPEFHGNRVENYNIQVISADPVHFTGLQVKKDPGIWVVYIGFLAMLLASGLAYYTSHRKLYFWASAAGSTAQKGTRVIVAGRTSKSSLAFEQEFSELCDQLKNQLQPAGKRK